MSLSIETKLENFLDRWFLSGKLEGVKRGHQYNQQKIQELLENQKKIDGALASIGSDIKLNRKITKMINEL